MSIDTNAINLYKNLVKDYFISRMFTEEDSKLISEQPIAVVEKFISLKRAKTYDEIVNALRDKKIPNSQK